MDSRIEGLDLRTFFRVIADFVMPRVCVVCGTRLLLQEEHICACCLSELPETHFARVSRNPMADAFNAGINASDADFERYCFATALFYYSTAEGYDNITQMLKYLRDIREGKWFAHLLGQRLAGSELYADVDLVVPVPLHWTRRLKRGYNQAKVIAREVARTLGVPCDSGLLRRCRRTGSQALLKDSEKTANVAGAFAVRTHRGRVSRPRHILLIDDVFTTGSTMQACHAALREVFGCDVRISAATLAYAGKQL